MNILKIKTKIREIIELCLSLFIITATIYSFQLYSETPGVMMLTCGILYLLWMILKYDQIFNGTHN